MINQSIRIYQYIYTYISILITNIYILLLYKTTTTTASCRKTKGKVVKIVDVVKMITKKKEIGFKEMDKNMHV